MQIEGETYPTDIVQVAKHFMANGSFEKATAAITAKDAVMAAAGLIATNMAESFSLFTFATVLWRFAGMIHVVSEHKIIRKYISNLKYSVLWHAVVADWHIPSSKNRNNICNTV